MSLLTGVVLVGAFTSRPFVNLASWECSVVNCSCQAFANFYGTHPAWGFGCAPAAAKEWWTQQRCHAWGDCPCCKGPGCKLPGAAPCVCPPSCQTFSTTTDCQKDPLCVWSSGKCVDAPPTPPPQPPSPPPPIKCTSPLLPEYICETCRRPIFSWDTLPVFVHVSAEDVLGFDQAALAVLLKFPIVTIEKWQGCYSPEYTTEEAAMLKAARSIKDAASEAGKHVSVIVWFDSFRIYPTNDSALNPDARNSAGIGCMNSGAAHFLESNRDHLLKNTSALPVIESFANLHVPDYQRRDMQIYKRDMCLNMTRSGYVDGCGIDGSQQRAGTNAIPNVPSSNVSAWNHGKVCMMNGTTNAIGRGLVVGKMEWELGGEYGYANGIIQEGCDNSNATVTNLRAVAQRSRQLGGVPLVYECHSILNCESCLAAFLVGAGENAFWGNGGWTLENESQLAERWSPMYERKLGEPLADAVYDMVTANWTRSFSSGTSVIFNARTGKGSVHWS